MSLAERASITEGARQRASAVAAAGPAVQQAIHTELRGAHAPPSTTAQEPARQPQQQQQPSSGQPAEVGRASAAHDLPRGGSPTSKVCASGAGTLPGILLHWATTGFDMQLLRCWV